MDPTCRTSSDRPPGVTLVAIAGGSGSGKSWLGNQLRRQLSPGAAKLSLDDFYLDLAMLHPRVRDRRNFDHPAALDWAAAGAWLEQVQAGNRPPRPDYVFQSHTRRPRLRPWSFRPLVLVEGLWSWWPQESRRWFALRIFCEAPEELRFRRRLERDRHQRGRSAASIRRQWNEQSEPMFRRHVLPLRDSADVILGPEPTPGQLNELAGFIRKLSGLASND